MLLFCHFSTHKTSTCVFLCCLSQCFLVAFVTAKAAKPNEKNCRFVFVILTPSSAFQPSRHEPSNDQIQSRKINVPSVVVVEEDDGHCGQTLASFLPWLFQLEICWLVVVSCSLSLSLSLCLRVCLFSWGGVLLRHVQTSLNSTSVSVSQFVWQTTSAITQAKWSAAFARSPCLWWQNVLTRHESNKTCNSGSLVGGLCGIVLQASMAPCLRLPSQISCKKGVTEA